MGYNDLLGTQLKHAYNVSLSLRVGGGDDELKRILLAFANIPKAGNGLIDWQIRVLDDEQGQCWAVFEGLIEADAPGTAAAMSEAWMEQVGGGIPRQRSSSMQFTAQVLA